MKGDFSRDSFDPVKHYTRVLMQQGRVQLDSDWNEQVNLFVHELRRLATELIGPHGGSGKGFEIVPLSEACDFGISFGTYFVDGIRCENLADTTTPDPPTTPQQTSLSYTAQPDYPSPPLLRSDGRYVIYLEVWEREITCINDPSLRESALGGTDTAIRTKVVWQVKAIEDRTGNLKALETQAEQFLRDALPQTTARLQVRRQPDYGNTGHLPLENHLYRVEIHRGGTLDDSASFKWSRDNGSRIFAVTRVAGDVVYVDDLRRGDESGLCPGSYVEYEDDESVLKQEPYGVMRVSAVCREASSVTLEDPTASLPKEGVAHHALLRLWDGPPQLLRNGAGTSKSDWISIENGIEIQFAGGTALSGDYWLIPSRTADADIAWPKEPKPPAGRCYHRAPLAAIQFVRGRTVELTDLRRVFCTQGKPATKL